MALVRLVVVGFIVLTVVYVCLSLYSRSVRRSKLEREFDQEILEGDRDEFVRQGLKDYDQSLRRKLILGVYVVPMLVVAVTVYVVNFM
ncbi:hypothetical protein PSA7680_01444 [Pseudoruegeria aquimaris]|uniref:Cation/multidrug efflux pump n=1 Tax=Pseudoruegeria aquimaris TaxID=393663 RepID=A0A1Y5S3B5_9RHOB|nr:hypothetical protein [Pseudoruegeria aquimaris]SLN30278.1 hypothetical protein PSA7680_01444 [Pseudoruegeria aquimaris]